MAMPTFLIIGAPKSGTTSLYHYVKDHPQIYMSPEKEPKFFAMEGENLDFRGPQLGVKHLISTSITNIKNMAPCSDKYRRK